MGGGRAQGNEEGRNVLHHYHPKSGEQNDVLMVRLREWVDNSFMHAGMDINDKLDEISKQILLIVSFVWVVCPHFMNFPFVFLGGKITHFLQLFGG